jgi:hypothetical protein
VQGNDIGCIPPSNSYLGIEDGSTAFKKHLLFISVIILDLGHQVGAINGQVEQKTSSRLALVHFTTLGRRQGSTMKPFYTNGK